MGRVWVLGRSDDTRYAVWNMVSGGLPVLYDEETDKGWKRLWQRWLAAEQGEKRGSGFLVGGFVEVPS
jgi:hypothetical protein